MIEFKMKAECDICGNDVESGEKIACWSCYQSEIDGRKESDNTIAGLEDKVASYAESIEALTDERVALEHEVASLSVELERKTAEIETLNANAVDLQHELTQG